RVTTPKSTTHGASPKPPTHSPSPPPSARVTTPKSTTHSASPKFTNKEWFYTKIGRF
ncbi:unnamed protein product, partial [Rotaria sp. Silwood1]